MHTNLDNFPLKRDELERYFRKMGISFEILLRTYQESGMGVESQEAIYIRAYLQRYINSLRALRIKYLFSEDNNLKIDRSDSGFPTYHEFSKLQVDMERTEAELAKIVPSLVLRRKMIDSIFTDRIDPTHMLPMMGYRAYLDELASHEQFLPFTPGQLLRLKDNSYVYHWACVDPSTNIPYMHFMAFESTYETPFHTSSEATKEFLRVIKSEGSRAPKLNILATSIDTELPHVHPKLIKRLSIGPFYSEGFSEPSSKEIQELLQVGKEGRRFILFLRSEHVFSSRQVTTNSFFSKGQKREIFHVPEYNTELYAKGISGEESSVILPHEILQHNRKVFDGHRICSFDTERTIHYG